MKLNREMDMQRLVICALALLDLAGNQEAIAANKPGGHPDA